MSQLKEQYEKETGERYGGLMCHVFAPTEGYVNWLEAKVEKLTTTNKAIAELPCLTCNLGTVREALVISGHNFCYECGRQLSQ